MPHSVDTYMVIAPDGSVKFDFTGHVTADGIDLLTGITTSPPDDRKIRWHLSDTTTGIVVGEISSFHTATISGTEIAAIASNLLKTSVFMEQAESGSAPDLSFVQAIAHVGGGGGAGVVIIDGNARSSFLKLHTQADRQIHFGNAGWNWPGASRQLNLTVTHNLGVVPLAIMITQANNNTVSQFRAYGGTTSQFTLNVSEVAGVTPPAGTSDNVWWIAIG